MLLTCPLGSECQTFDSSGQTSQCAWYIKLQGKNPQSGESVDEYRCSMAWQPILAIEGNGLIGGTNASIQSMRNETVARQNLALGALNSAKTITSD